MKLIKLSKHNLNQICNRVSCPAKSQDMTNNDNPFTPKLSDRDLYFNSVSRKNGNTVITGYNINNLNKLPNREIFKIICGLPR